MEISLAYSALDSGTAREAAPTTGAEGRSPQLSAPAAPSFDELPPEDDVPRLKPQVDAGLGKCPTHGTAWTVKAGGMSTRTNKPFDAFYKCSEKDGDVWCTQKPQKIWRDTHPIAPGVGA
jgi:hypothetical protein